MKVAVRHERRSEETVLQNWHSRVRGTGQGTVLQTRFFSSQNIVVFSEKNVIIFTFSCIIFAFSTFIFKELIHIFIVLNHIRV